MILAVPIVALLALLAACAPAPDAPDDAGAADPAPAPPATPTNRIAVPPTVRRNLGVTFATVELRHVARTLRVPGAFELQPLARHEYRMALPGHVRLLVDQYERVEPGQPLFRFRSPAWPELQHEIIAAEQAMDVARAEIDVGRARLQEAERRAELARGRIELLAQVDVRRADLELEASEIEASLARLRAEVVLAQTHLANAERTREHALVRASAASSLPVAELVRDVDVDGRRVPAYETVDWIEVHAVESGVVEALAVTDGAFVEPPAAVLATVDPALVRFRALALQADLPRLAAAGAVRIVPPETPGIPIDDAVEASLATGLEAHPEQRTLALLATPKELASWIRPGVAAFLEIEVASSDGPSLAVPRSCVVQDGLVHVVFRRDPADPNTVIRIEADMGVDDGRWVVLHSGVMRGDELVLDGAYELKLAAQPGGAAPAGGHVHADGTFHDEH